MIKYYVQRGMYLWNEDRYYLIEVKYTNQGVGVRKLRKGILGEGINWVPMKHDTDTVWYPSFDTYTHHLHDWQIYEIDEEEAFFKLL